MTAKKWVEKNKINKKMDKTAEDYVQRVLVLISSGSSVCSRIDVHPGCDLDTKVFRQSYQA